MSASFFNVILRVDVQLTLYLLFEKIELTCIKNEVIT